MAATPNRGKTAAVAARREAAEQEAEAAATTAGADPENKEDIEGMATVSAHKLKQACLLFQQVGHPFAAARHPHASACATTCVIPSKRITSKTKHIRLC